MLNFIKTKTNIKGRIRKTKGWLERNEKYLTVGFFTLGLVVDSFTLTKVNMSTGNLILLGYLGLAVLGIFLLAAAQVKESKTFSYESEQENRHWLVKISKYIPFLTQYAFGGLFSGYIIYYTKSASWATSWVFLVLLIALFIGNERFRKSYKKIDFQINMLFISIFSFMIFFVPMLLKIMGTWVFVLSGVLSLLVLYFLVYLLSKYVLHINKKRKEKIVKHILGVFLVFNVLYFLNIIPPIPLSMKEIGIYDYIRKDAGGEYIFIEKELPWYSFGNYFLKVSEGRAYIYQSIFAPANLNTKIYNIWQKFDIGQNRWITLNEVYFPITGGRSEGYRGFSFMSDVSAGLWRVDVRTKEGLVVGRIKFKVTEN